MRGTEHYNSGSRLRLPSRATTASADLFTHVNECKATWESSSSGRSLNSRKASSARNGKPEAVRVRVIEPAVERR